MNTAKKLFSLLSKRTEVSDTLIKTFGFFGAFNFPFFYLVRQLSFTEEREFLFFRLTCFLICIPLLLLDYWPRALRQHKIIYWYFSICYCFPFFSTYMLIENYGSTIWFTKVILALFWLVLITDWLTFLIILPLGILMGYLVHYFINGPAQIDMDVFVGLSVNYLWAVLIGTVFSRIKDNTQSEKLTAMKSLAGTIAHEMRTPFLGIRSNAGGIKKFLPPLIDGYHKAKQAGLDIEPISERSLHLLKQAPESLDKITLSASLVIDMLLMSLKDEHSHRQDYEDCSINQCISEMLQDYPLTPAEKSLITWTENPDFSFKGHKLLMRHVLFNLLKNALYSLKAANKGKILIWTQTTPKENFLYFKDTGKGIPASMIPHIFDRFYSRTHHGTGLGLAFCTSVMESFRGSIRCDSTEREYTLFTLKFPRCPL